MTPELKAQIEAALEHFACNCGRFCEEKYGDKDGCGYFRAAEAVALFRSIKEEPSEGETARLTSLLNERDNFIVGEGLWQKFCESLSGRAAKDEPSEAVNLSAIVDGQLQEPMMAVLPDGTAVCMGGRWRGWLFRKHPDGQWVSMLKLEQEDPLIAARNAR